MDKDMDALLGALRSQPTHPGLTAIEDAVFARAVQPRPGNGRMAIAAALGAVTLGIAGAGIGANTNPAQAQASLMPLGPASPLLPSTLLAGAE